MERDRNQYFIFSSHRSRYAIDALSVLETFRLSEITPVEETPPYIAGVINFRGKTLPVMDLNIRFGRSPERYQLTDGVIVVEAAGRTIGVIVNDVHDVMAIPPEEIDPVPYPAETGDPCPRFVIGVAKTGEEIIMVVDHELLSSLAEFATAPTTNGATDSSGAADSGEVASDSAIFDFSDEERAIFHQRALELITKAEEQDHSGFIRMAVALLSGEYVGVELSLVREFAPVTTSIPIPNCPEQIVGVMNLRGDIITLMDIRPALEMPAATFAMTAKIIVITNEMGTVGVVVDDIVDIMSLNPSDISPLPASISPVVAAYATGVAGFGGRAVILLDLTALLASTNFSGDNEK